MKRKESEGRSECQKERKNELKCRATNARWSNVDTQMCCRLTRWTLHAVHWSHWMWFARNERWIMHSTNKLWISKLNSMKKQWNHFHFDRCRSIECCLCFVRLFYASLFLLFEYSEIPTRKKRLATRDNRRVAIWVDWTCSLPSEWTSRNDFSRRRHIHSILLMSNSSFQRREKNERRKNYN